MLTILTSLLLPYFVFSRTFENVTVFVNDNRTIFMASYDSLSFCCKNFTVINIEDQRISVLSEKSISNLPYVSEIKIIRCGVRKIENKTFENVNLLRILNLSANYLEVLENGAFNNLDLTVLDLTDNWIEMVHDDVFATLSNLTEVILTNNRLSQWNSNWYLKVYPETIKFSGNYLETLPSNAFGNITYIKTLDLSHNKFTKIHSEAFNGVTRIGVVSFEHNLLKHLPNTLFSTVSNINTLKLNNNIISNVDNNFLKLEINHLNLNNNKLKCISKKFLQNVRVYYIYIFGNEFRCDCVKKWQVWEKEFYVHIKSWNVVINYCNNTNVVKSVFNKA